MTIAKFQKQAKSMIARSKKMHLQLSYQQALELIAAQNGYSSWIAFKKDQESINTDTALKEKFCKCTIELSSMELELAKKEYIKLEQKLNTNFNKSLLVKKLARELQLPIKDLKLSKFRDSDILPEDK